MARGAGTFDLEPAGLLQPEQASAQTNCRQEVRPQLLFVSRFTSNDSGHGNVTSSGPIFFSFCNRFFLFSLLTHFTCLAATITGSFLMAFTE